ncbi:MAG: aldehyde ferredoxin oxidoreductase family protein [Anaerolineaceae bacterium]
MLPKSAARILKVDLSTRSSTVDIVADQSLIRKTLGGRGLATYIYFRDYDLSLDPFDERSPMIIASGSITGSNFPCSGRTSIIYKSPVTGSFFKSNVGGHFGAGLKFSGYDMIIVTGKSEKPCYIVVTNNKVEVKDAGNLWGMDNRTLYETLHDEYEDDSLEITSIGPAGENKILFSTINSSIYNVAARGGGGAVMGDKKLKCIAVMGDQFVEFAEPLRFQRAKDFISQKMEKVPGVVPLTTYGTSVGIQSTNAIGAFPVRNFQENRIDNVELLSGQHLVESGLLKNRIGCFSCSVSCHRYCTVEDGRFKGTFGGGPEYETLASLGAGCGSTDVESVLKANEYCNIYGMDVISTGSVIQWLMECKQRGLVDDSIADGLDLSWGNGDTVVQLTRMIAFREGVGDLLADGVKKASAKLGGESEKWAIQAKGLEQSRVETRAAYGYALAFAINSRGPDHLNTEPLAEFGGDSAGVDTIERITGSEKYAYPSTTEKRPEIVRWHEDIYAAGDSMGICAFPTTAQFWVDEFDMAELFSAASGIEIDGEELLESGQRTILLERMCMATMGFDREFDKLPYRLMHEEMKGAKHKNAVNSAEMLEPMKDEYYKLHGWDIEHGWPTSETIANLGFPELLGKYKPYKRA